MVMDAKENVERLKKIREDFLKSVDFMISEAETERRKLEAEETPIQGKKKESKLTEEELRQEYPFTEAEEQK